MKPLQFATFSCLTGIFAVMVFTALTKIAPDLIQWAPFLSAWQEILSATCLVHLGRIGWRCWTDP